MELIYQIVLMLALAAVIVFLAQKLKVPSIVGFLATGILLGPSGFALIDDPHTIDLLAEMGIVLLLFTIGLEFSLRQLFSLRRAVFLGGAAQVTLTLVVVAGLAVANGRTLNQAIFLGLILSLSSTAIVLKLLQQRAELDTPHGLSTLGILIFQDLLIVPAMLAIPLLAGVHLDGDSQASAGMLLKVLLSIPLLWVAAKYLFPAILHQVAGTRNRELFMLSILVLGFSVAGLSASMGLSLALGAFLAGLLISESPYSHQALGSILPFRDVFISFFFISVGLLLDLSFVASRPLYLVGVTLGLLVLKSLSGAVAGRLSGLSWPGALAAGAAISQVGEFSLLLSRAGLDHGLLSPRSYQTFLAVTVLSMTATPFAMGIRPWVARRFTSRAGTTPPAADASSGGLLIIGYGLNGRNLARVASATGIAYRIIEMNPDTVRQVQRQGIPILYGDAANEQVLTHAGGHLAKVAVVAINDAAATRRIVELLRRINPGLYLIARTRFVAEVPVLYRLGADEVIPEEFETSVEIFARVMRRYALSSGEIEAFVRQIRADGYEMLRSPRVSGTAFDAIHPLFRQAGIDVVTIGPDSPFAGLPLSQSQVRSRHHVTVLGIHRDEALIANPQAGEVLLPGDRLILFGKARDIEEFARATPADILPRDDG